MNEEEKKGLSENVIKFSLVCFAVSFPKSKSMTFHQYILAMPMPSKWASIPVAFSRSIAQ